MNSSTPTKKRGRDSNSSTPTKKKRSNSTDTIDTLIDEKEKSSSNSSAKTEIVEDTLGEIQEGFMKRTMSIEERTRKEQERIRKILDEERKKNKWGQTPPTARVDYAYGRRICKKEMRDGIEVFIPITTEALLVKNQDYYNCDEPHELIEKNELNKDFVGGFNKSKKSKKGNKSKKSKRKTRKYISKKRT